MPNLIARQINRYQTICRPISDERLCDGGLATAIVANISHAIHHRSVFEW